MPYSHPQTVDKATVYHDWRHILPGAMSLCATAGYVNSVVLGFFDTPVSHMSGAVSRLGLNVAERYPLAALSSLLIILGFFSGAVLAGVFVGATKLVPSRRYGAVMMFEGFLLFLAAMLLWRKSMSGPILAAIACGLQNAMSSSYCGLMIRTTHVSGIVTDFGVMIGHWLRHRRIVKWKLKFLSGLLLSFFVGGVCGAFLDMLYGPLCLILAAVACLVAGAIFYAILHRQSNIEEERNALPRTSIFPDD